jgi:hypothetical protein
MNTTFSRKARAIMTQPHKIIQYSRPRLINNRLHYDENKTWLKKDSKQ